MNHPTPQVDVPTSAFTQLLSSTPRGARLARLLAMNELRTWNVPENITERAELVVAELANNAAVHGKVPGRGFRLTLTWALPPETLHIEVTDARGDHLPDIPPQDTTPDPFGIGGRGLTLVTALADHWDTVPYPPTGKTIRALFHTPGPGLAAPAAAGATLPCRAGDASRHRSDPGGSPVDRPGLSRQSAVPL
ncbi:ATP-binding protein [Streptomyces sp. NPDC047000]|uniref:ATP-binding protein n=1 Tax=Streptomyces sp. NPDC047000 TaxID=3155474 RepID=UPI0033CB59DB